tara:strand:- start:325 stop:1596 length:1272 start_codon:yes stop_codon:yes gene_type:complete
MKKLEVLLEELGRLHPKYIDLSLSRIKKLLAKMGNPHLKLPPCIHIAGTNGKGSTLNLIKSIMLESNYKVHAYISPHLEKINERFIISNKMISNDKLFKALKYVKKINNNKSITFYEITTATAFYLFNNNNADFLLLETGLGGRLDATNVLDQSLLSIITPIGLDHEEYLGKSIYKILNEKLGIIKKNSVIISSKQNQIIQKKICIYARKNKNKIISYESDWTINRISKKYFYINKNNKSIRYKIPSLLGEHQIYNASTAIATINYLIEKGYKFQKTSINKGLVNVKWPCRLEVIKNKKPIIIIDGAHNKDGAIMLRKFILKSNYKTWIILGMINTKNIILYLKQLKNCVKGISAITIPEEKNSFTNYEIKKHCDALNMFCLVENNPKEAIKRIIKNYNMDQIIITGSLYLAGKIKKDIKLLN